MRIDTEFDSDGSLCAAWFYKPKTQAPWPCVVMAHGFSAVREQRLDAYAERFAQAGIAVWLFDYRHFGASAGEPRQLLSIRRQLQDWQAAINAARAMPEIDVTRIALFGSSFSGGHVQMLAARDSTIAAVVAQVPFCDGMQLPAGCGAKYVLSLLTAGLRDVAGALFGLQPSYIAAVGAPGTRAVMITPDATGGFSAMNPDGSHWQNRVAARIALTIGLYRPGYAARRIRCPILYCIGTRDLLCPPATIEAAAKRAQHAEIKRYDCGHFDIYIEPWWNSAVADQIEFLVRHLKH